VNVVGDGTIAAILTTQNAFRPKRVNKRLIFNGLAALYNTFDLISTALLYYIDTNK